MSSTTQTYKHVNDLWDDSVAAGLDPVERLVYRSNILGADQRITNTGGGNTSSKLTERDPLTGEDAEVLWVKGSGGDLRTSKRENFSSLYMDRLYGLQGMYDAMEPKGLKTPAEDSMVGLYRHCTFNLNPRASSIDTPLHAFVPAKHVDHTHPNAVISIAAAKNSREITQKVYGDEVGWVPWERPGFELGLTLERACKADPSMRGIVMGAHGLINWDDDDRECYRLSLDLIEKAARYIEDHDKGEQTFGGARYEDLSDERRRELLIELMPWLRGRLTVDKRWIGTVQATDEVRRFVNSNDAKRLAGLGTSCPDHFLRTKIKPLLVEWDPQSGDMDTLRTLLDQGLEQYRADYATYYDACKHPDSPAMRDPIPTVVLVPGLGMIAWGKSKSESRVTAEFYTCAVEVMRGAEAIDEYVALPQQEAFDIEYWALEEAKLQRMPPEKSLARHVSLIVGAGNGIGACTAERLSGEGAHLVCADLDADAAKSTADAIVAKQGAGIGVAGTGISGCGPAISTTADVTNRDTIRAAIEETILAYGGIDDVVVTAGIYTAAGADGSFSSSDWQKTFDVNVMGAWQVADEVRKVWAAQGLSGSLVLTTSVNGVVPKRGSLAYDTSKAAANHLVRELAMELAPHVRVNAVAPATVVEGSTMFPRDRVIASLKRYGLEAGQDESTETLRDRLAGFYAQRTLLAEPITPSDQAEAIYFLVADTARRTTGQVISVDGGLPEAFVR